MKKFLLSTSAIVGVGLIAAPAGAAERIKLSIGGDMTQWIGFANVEEDVARDFATIDQKNSSEVHFSGSTTLDNGIKIAVKFEFEGDGNNGGTPDESWMQISSDSLGLLGLGEDDAAANNTRYGMPDVGIGDGDAPNWVPGLGNVRFSNNIGRDGDEQKITYYTPTAIQKVTGLQVGASFIPEPGNMANAQPNSVADNQNAYSLAVTFKSGAMGLDLGGVNLNVQYGYLHESDGQRTGSAVGGGGHQVSSSIGYAGFTVAGAYTRRLTNNSDRGTATNEDDGHGFEIGVSYAQGPYKVSAGYSEYTTAGAVNAVNDDEGDLWMVSGAYALSDGVDLKASVFDVDYDDEGNPLDAAETDGGWGAVAGIVVNF